MATEAERASLLRILIATDNHLGVWEKDPVRKDDSFNSFDEIFQIALERDVDFVLLGGDLFHDNKPSRNTLVRAIEILEKYTLSDRPIAFQILSDQEENFVSGRVNFDNPNHNVGLPVFTIHGNHDDPAGADNLSAVDVLSSCKLVNYFGKASLGGSNIGKVKISPILLEKGKTRVALFGLGNVRDERLGRMFQTPGCIEWARPADDAEYPLDEWHNILVLHQNRAAHTQAAKNFIKETFLPGFLDLVIWGHEHECIPDPVDTSHGVSILQPGSSVATALSEGESKKKHVIVLEILDQSFRCVKQELQTVRPFRYGQVVLADQVEVDAHDGDAVGDFLEDRVQSMVDECNRRSRKSGADPKQPPPLPLIRLKVDYTGFSTINSQRFGQKFVGKVANPHDVLHWHKAAAKKPTKVTEADAPPNEAPDENHIEDLIAENLIDSLAILPEADLANALHEFVEKVLNVVQDEKQALKSCVDKILHATQVAAAVTQQQAESARDEDVAAFLEKHAEERKRQSESMALSRERRAELSLPPPSKEGPSQNPSQPLRKRPAPDDSDGGEEGTQPPAKKPARGRGAGRGRGRGKGGRQATLGETVARSKRGGETPPLQTRTTRQSPRKNAGAPPNHALAAAYMLDDSSEDGDDQQLGDIAEDEVEDSEKGDDSEGEQVPVKKRGRARLMVKPTAAAKNPASQQRRGAVGSIMIDSDDDEAGVQPSAGNKAGRKLPGSLFNGSQAVRSQGLFGSARR